jgi:hypothetical protein
MKEIKKSNMYVRSRNVLSLIILKGKFLLDYGNREGEHRWQAYLNKSDTLLAMKLLSDLVFME